MRYDQSLGRELFIDFRRQVQRLFRLSSQLQTFAVFTVKNDGELRIWLQQPKTAFQVCACHSQTWTHHAAAGVDHADKRFSVTNSVHESFLTGASHAADSTSPTLLGWLNSERLPNAAPSTRPFNGVPGPIDPGNG